MIKKGKICQDVVINFQKMAYKKLEKETFLGICSFQGLLGNNEDSLIFPEFWGRINIYFNGENWGIFGVGTVKYFGE